MRWRGLPPPFLSRCVPSGAGYRPESAGTSGDALPAQSRRQLMAGRSSGSRAEEMRSGPRNRLQAERSPAPSRDERHRACLRPTSYWHNSRASHSLYSLPLPGRGSLQEQRMTSALFPGGDQGRESLTSSDLSLSSTPDRWQTRLRDPRYIARATGSGPVLCGSRAMTGAKSEKRADLSETLTSEA